MKSEVIVVTERERLIELIKKGFFTESIYETLCTNKRKASEYLADYLFANGVVVLPVDIIGNTLWFINCDNNIVCDKINKITICDSHDVYIFLQNSGDEPYELSNVGKFLFYTREEAENALKEQKK